MAPLKQPPKLAGHLLSYVENWLIRLVVPISEHDHDGNLSDNEIKLLETVSDHLEPWLPSVVASNLIEKIFHASHYDTAMKYAVLLVNK